MLQTDATIKQTDVDFQAEMNKLKMTLTKKEDLVLFTMLKRIEDFEKSSRAMQKATYQISLKNKEMMIDLEKKVQKLVAAEMQKKMEKRLRDSS